MYIYMYMYTETLKNIDDQIFTVVLGFVGKKNPNSWADEIPWKTSLLQLLLSHKYLAFWRVNWESLRQQMIGNLTLEGKSTQSQDDHQWP